MVNFRGVVLDCFSAGGDMTPYFTICMFAIAFFVLIVFGVELL